MTSFISELLEFFIVSYAIWVGFCVVTQTTNPLLTTEEFKTNLLLPLRFSKKWIDVAIKAIRNFFQSNM